MGTSNKMWPTVLSIYEWQKCRAIIRTSSDQGVLRLKRKFYRTPIRLPCCKQTREHTQKTSLVNVRKSGKEHKGSKLMDWEWLKS